MSDKRRTEPPSLPSAMTVKTMPPIAKTGRRAGWTDLLALTMPGIRRLGLVRTRVIAGALPWTAGEGACHLIVQVYDCSELGSNDLPRAGARPLGSAQRTIQREDFYRGVELDVPLLDRPKAGVLALAWLDAGKRYEEDPFEARPEQSHSLGVVLAPDAGDAEIVLGSHAA
jgi:hypothetical protein